MHKILILSVILYTLYTIEIDRSAMLFMIIGAMYALIDDQKEGDQK